MHEIFRIYKCIIIQVWRHCAMNWCWWTTEIQRCKNPCYFTSCHWPLLIHSCLTQQLTLHIIIPIHIFLTWEYYFTLNWKLASSICLWFMTFTAWLQRVFLNFSTDIIKLQFFNVLHTYLHSRPMRCNTSTYCVNMFCCSLLVQLHKWLVRR